MKKWSRPVTIIMTIKLQRIMICHDLNKIYKLSISKKLVVHNKKIAILSRKVRITTILTKNRNLKIQILAKRFLTKLLRMILQTLILVCNSFVDLDQVLILTC